MIEESEERTCAEAQEYMKLLERMEKENNIRRRYYITVSISKADYKKIRRWLDNHDRLSIATDNDHKLSILNDTATMATHRSRELFGVDSPMNMTILAIP